MCFWIQRKNSRGTTVGFQKLESAHIKKEIRIPYALFLQKIHFVKCMHVCFCMNNLKAAFTDQEVNI